MIPEKMVLSEKSVELEDGLKKESANLVDGRVSLEQVLTQYVGSFGFFQKLLTVFIILFVGPLTSMNMITQFLIFLTPPHHCKLPDQSALNGLTANISTLEQSTFYHHDGNCMIKPQLSYLSNSSETISSIACPIGWEYDYKLVYPTLISEKDWVCENRWKSLLPHSVYWCGAFIGCFVFGAISDHFGRVWTTVIIFTTAGVSGLMGLFLTDYYSVFVLSRGLMGFAFTGSVTLVLVIEFVGLSKRLLVSTSFVASHSLTSAIWSSLGYLISDWRLVLALASGLQLTIPLISIFIPESVRWLYSKGRTEEGSKVLKKLAIFNGRKIPDHVIDAIIFRQPKPVTFRDFIIYKRLTANFALVGLISILNGIVYIGANLYAALVVKNPFLVLTINGTIDFFAGLISKGLADKYGRKIVLISALFASFVLYEGCYFLPKQYFYLMTAFYLARMSVSMVFNILYLFAAEIVPTSFRSRAVSTRLCLNNFGAFIAPLTIATHVIDPLLPLAIFGLTAIGAAMLAFLLPETLGVPLPETCEEANKLK